MGTCLALRWIRGQRSDGTSWDLAQRWTCMGFTSKATPSRDREQIVTRWACSHTLQSQCPCNQMSVVSTSIYLYTHTQKHISNSLLCTFYIFPVIVGVFEVSCLVSDHYVGGMRQLYRVMGSEDEDLSVLESQIVEYFICAEEVEWDYSPDRTWELQNFNTTEDNRSVNIQQLLLVLQYLNGICNQILVSVLAVCLWGRERTD